MIATENVITLRNRLAKAIRKAEQAKANSGKQYDEILNALIRDVDTIISAATVLLAPVETKPTVWHTNAVIARVIQHVADEYGVTEAQILTDDRRKQIVRPRHIAIYATRVLCSGTVQDIGFHFGKRHHATILHAIKKVGSDPEMKGEAQAVADAVGTDMRKV